MMCTNHNPHGYYDENGCWTYPSYTLEFREPREIRRPDNFWDDYDFTLDGTEEDWSYEDE
jgi:hypothetical protein